MLRQINAVWGGREFELPVEDFHLREHHCRLEKITIKYEAGHHMVCFAKDIGLAWLHDHGEYDGKTAKIYCLPRQAAQGAEGAFNWVAVPRVAAVAEGNCAKVISCDDYKIFEIIFITKLEIH